MHLVVSPMKKLLLALVLFLPLAASAQWNGCPAGFCGPKSVAAAGIIQVQHFEGSTINTASIATSLPGATTAGHSIMIFAQGAGTITTPAGFTSESPQVNQQGFYVFDKMVASGNSTDTPTLTMSGTFTATWMIVEYSGLTAIDTSSGNNGSTGNNTTPIATPSITPTAGTRLLVAAVGGVRGDPSAFDPGTNPSTWTSSFVGQASVQQASGGGTGQAALGHGWAAETVTANGSTAFSTSAILTNGATSSYAPASIIAAYK